MKRTKTTAQKQINRMYNKRNYTKINNELEAFRKLNMILAKYTDETRKKVLRQVDDVKTTYSKMLTFVQATERYNKNIHKERETYINNVIKPNWEEHVKNQSENWRNIIYSEKGNLTTTGKQVYENFVENNLYGVVPKSEKTIVLSESLKKMHNFDITLATRMSMGKRGYLLEKQEEYEQNYINALRKTKLNPQPFIDEYNRLTPNEKREFNSSPYGQIQFVYTASNNLTGEAEYFQEFENEIQSIINER